MNYLQKAIKNLRPNASFGIEDTYESLIWFSADIEPPTKEEVEREADKIKKEYEKTEYKRLRELEYPDFREYLDGIVKGDKNQMQKYIDACIQVKKKYPKS